MIQIEDGRKQFFQWDTGRMISFAGKCEQFHFQKKQFGRTVDVDASFDGEKSSCKVPDFLLQISGKFSVYAFIGTAEDGYTKIEKEFDVIARNKPADYVFTPQEQKTIKDAQKYADEAKASAETAVNASGVSMEQAERAKTEADRAQIIVDAFQPEGVGENYELIDTIIVNEPGLKAVKVSKESSGKLYNFKKIFIRIFCKKNPEQPRTSGLYVQTSGISRVYIREMQKSASDAYAIADIDVSGGINKSCSYNSGVPNIYSANTIGMGYYGFPLEAKNVTDVNFLLQDGAFGVGSTFEIWAVRA